MGVEKPRLILVGPGWWGKRWVRAIQDCEHCDLVGLVARTRKTLAAVCTEFELDPKICATDCRDAFSRIEADVAVILVPPAAHKDVTLAALEAGLHVLAEKPIAATWDDAIRMHEAWNKAHRPCFMVTQTRRWSDHISTLKRFVESGALGKVGTVNTDYRTHRVFDDWRSQLQYPLLEDMSTHHFDQMRHLTGCEPLTVFCHSFHTPWDWFAGDTGAAVIVEMTDQVRCSYLGCWTTQGKETSPEGNITIVGEKGSLELRGVHRIMFCPQGGQPEKLAMERIPRSYIEYALDEFLTALREERLPECHITDNLKTFAMTCAAIESSKRRKPVGISEFLDQVEGEPGKEGSICRKAHK